MKRAALILVLFAAGCVSSPLPRLVIVGGPASHEYCRGTGNGKLLVTVRNDGTFGSRGGTVTVQFFGGSAPVVQPLPSLAPGASADVFFTFPSGCFTPDCSFQIVVKSSRYAWLSPGVVATANGHCIG